MTRNINLYHNLVKNEDTLTELLANLLQFPAFKDAFTTFLAKELSLPDFSFIFTNVETQKVLTEQGRLDLVIENESFCIVIECKVDDYRGLTDHQPVSYLNYLRTQANKTCALIFLLPYHYQHETLIRNRAATSKTKIPLKVIYWTDLIRYLESAKIADQNIALEHFVALLKARFTYQPIIFSQEEIVRLQDKDFPAALLKLFELINAVGDKIGTSYKTRNLSNEFGYGYYVKNQNGENLLWFGCDFEFWKSFGHPLVFGVGDDGYQEFSRAVINRFTASFQSAIQHELDPGWGPWYIVPMTESLLEEPNKVEKTVELIAKAAASCDNSKTKHR